MSAVAYVDGVKPIWEQLLEICAQAPDPLAERAALLYPHSEPLQREWLRAVQVVRATRRGWLLERHVQRVEASR